MTEPHSLHATPAPMVSVVVPNYNYARYLPERLDSIFSQTYTDFEVILLDDASTDGSAAVMRRYAADPRVAHVVVNPANTGSPFPQWMKGIGMARGKYVWIAEADDTADPHLLETLVRHAEARPDTAVCYAGTTLIDSDGREIKRDVNHWGLRGLHEARAFDGPLYARRNLYWKNYIINASAALLRRDAALAVPRDFMRMRYCGDWLFWFEMALRGSVVEVYRPLNYFRQHAAKATGSSTKHGGGIAEDIDIIARMESVLRPGSYRRRLRRGLLYRKIRHLHLPADARRTCLALMRTKLDGGRADYVVHRLNRITWRWLPFLPNINRDRL